MNTFTYYNKVSYTSVLDYIKTETSTIYNPSLSYITVRFSRPQTDLNYQSRTLEFYQGSKVELFFHSGVEQ